MQDFEAVYIVANTPTICENIIKNYLWNGTPFSASIEKRTDYERKNPRCSPDLLRASVNSKLYTILHDEKEFVKFLNEQRKKIISPAYRTVQAYISGDYEFSGTVYELYNILQGHKKHEKASS